MAFKTPGVYVQEAAPQLSPIVNAGTSNTAFFGLTTRGPCNKPIALNSYSDFTRVFGASRTGDTSSFAVKGFFDNGGNKAYFVRLSGYDTTTGAEHGSAASLPLALDNGGSITFKSAYRGAESLGTSGNSTYVSVVLDPMHPAATSGGDLSAAASAGDTSIRLNGVTGISPGSFLKLVEGGTSEVVEVSRVSSAVVSGVITHTVYLVSALTNTYTTAATAASLEYTITVEDSTGVVFETWTKLSPSPYANNNMDLVINDPELGSSYIMTTTALGTGKGDASAAFAADSTWATGKALTNGADEHSLFDKLMFASNDETLKGIRSIDQLRDAQLICLPPNSDTSLAWGIKADASFHGIALEYCKSRMNLFAILDAPADKSAAEMVIYRNITLGADSAWGAMFYPHVKVQDPARPQTSATIVVPPSGFVAGVMSRVDAMSPPNGGVSAAAAGVSEFGRVDGILGVERIVSDKDQESLNPIGVNTIRLLDRATGGKGIFVYGARTLSSDINFKYIPLRRTLTFVEETVRLSSQFAVFQKNGPELWSRLSQNIESFLSQFWRAGNLAGSNAREAYFVEIGSTTTSADDIANGILRGRIGVSLHRPAEFIVFTFVQTTSGSTVQEG